MASKLESTYQASLLKRLRKAYRGRILATKTDPGMVQGIPDLIVLCGGRYALLEVKRSVDASKRPNQAHYIEKFGRESFASFIYPENEHDVIYEMCDYFGLDFNLFLKEK